MHAAIFRKTFNFPRFVGEVVRTRCQHSLSRWGYASLMFLGAVLFVLTTTSSRAEDSSLPGFEKFDKSLPKFESLTSFLRVAFKDWPDGWQYIRKIRQLESGNYLLQLESAPLNAGLWYFDQQKQGLRRLSGGYFNSIREIQSNKKGEILLLLLSGLGGGGIATHEYDLVQIGPEGLARRRSLFYVESDMEGGLCGRWGVKRIRNAGAIEKEWILEGRMPARLALLVREQDCGNRKIRTSVKMFNLTAADWKAIADDEYIQKEF